MATYFLFQSMSYNHGRPTVISSHMNLLSLNKDGLVVSHIVVRERILRVSIMIYTCGRLLP